jgi:SAM-dependent methyltransferase
LFLLGEGCMDIKDLQKNWNEFGRTDPLWAILTAPDKRGGKWQVSDFFDTGKTEIDSLLEELNSLGLDIRQERALDFGCGVGRLTQALAEHFDHVTGVDIAPSMIEQAKQYNRFDDRCTYVLNERDDLAYFSDESFDLIYSNYTLQHMQPRYAERYLAEFVRLLTPSGVLVFQLPSRHVPLRTFRQVVKSMIPPLALNLYFKVRRGDDGKQPVMETYVIPKDRVIQVLEAQGATVVHVYRDPHHDRRWISLTYYVSKG